MSRRVCAGRETPPQRLQLRGGLDMKHYGCVPARKYHKPPASLPRGMGQAYPCWIAHASASPNLEAKAPSWLSLLDGARVTALDLV